LPNFASSVRFFVRKLYLAYSFKLEVVVSVHSKCSRHPRSLCSRSNSARGRRCIQQVLSVFTYKSRLLRDAFHSYSQRFLTPDVGGFGGPLASKGRSPLSSSSLKRSSPTTSSSTLPCVGFALGSLLFEVLGLALTMSSLRGLTSPST